MSQLPPGPPPPPGAPPGPPSYGGYGGPPQGAPPGYGGYGGPPPPGAPPGGYGGPPPSGGSSKGPLIAVVAVVAVLVVVAVVGVVFVATRGGGGTADLTASEMRRALLEEDDVGDGFVESDTGDSGETDVNDLDADEECMDLLREFEDEDSAVIFAPANDDDGAELPNAEISFSDEDDNAQLQQGITIDDRDALDIGRRVTETCDQIDLDDGDTTAEIEYTLGDPIEDLGDDSITVEVSFRADEPTDFELEFDIAIWTRDGIVSSLSLTGGLDDDFESTPPDREQLEDLAVAADEKLEAAIEEDG